ncbi:BQ2448_336 [Microbotryum intermedium]|uniref:BQ2448_336 protein n=1 Tax=Microbotryum intermedium TaxID=269621 RepID=A0A238F597_9BASI|nr:BQ2448_336 [Microbotryum intermedium]
MMGLPLAATAPKASRDEDGGDGTRVLSNPAVTSDSGTNTHRPSQDSSHWTCSFNELDDEKATVSPLAGKSKHWRHWWHLDYRIYFCMIVICFICALSLFHPLLPLNRQPSKPLPMAKRDAADRRSLNAPLTAASNAEDSKVPTRRQEVLDDLPAWADYDAIDSKTLRLSNTLAPVFMHHLLESDTPAPYDRVHIISAFLDTRPLVMDERHEIIIHGVLNGVKEVNAREGLTYPDGIVECSIFVRGLDGTTYAGRGKVKAMIAHGRRYQYMTLSQGQFVCSLGMIPAETYRSIDWQQAEIFATITAIDQEPPADVFTRVRPIAALDVEKHRTGRGQGAVCIAPLHGDLYAPVLRDHLSYQKSLGFTKIYAYLLDPGPVTLAIVRELASTDPDFVPIRWGIPQEWATKARTKNTHMHHHFAVDPSEWNVRGIDVLDPEREELLGVADNGDHPTVGIWYWGQNLAGQDCHMRAMADGVRWVATIDWDEYFVLQPSGQLTWTPPPRSADPETAMTPFYDWIRAVPQWRPNGNWHYMLHPRTISRLEIDLEEATRGLLPSAFLFSHSLGRGVCLTRTAPPASAVLDEVMDRFGEWDWKRPGVTVPIAFSTPIGSPYMAYGQRSKKILDPWAFFLDGTHTTVLGYADYSLEFSICSAPGKSSRQRRICAQSILRAFGSHPVPVPLPKALADRGPQTARPADADAEYASGVLRHFRVDISQTLDVLALTKDLTEMPASLLTSEDSRRVRSKLASRPCLKLIEDWSLVTIMEQSLKWIFQDRVEAPTKPQLPPFVIPAKPTYKAPTLTLTPPAEVPAKLRPSKESSPDGSEYPVEALPPHETEGLHSDDEMIDPVEQGIGGRLGQTIAANPYGLTLAAVGVVLAFYLVERRKERSRPRQGYVMVEQTSTRTC